MCEDNEETSSGSNVPVLTGTTLIWADLYEMASCSRTISDIAYYCIYKNILHCFLDHTSELICGGICRMTVRHLFLVFRVSLL